MADQKLTDLAQFTSYPANTDLLYLGRDPAGSPLSRGLEVEWLRRLNATDLAGSTALEVNKAYFDTFSGNRVFNALPTGTDGDVIRLDFDVTVVSRTLNFHNNSTVYRVGEAGALGSAITFDVGNHRLILVKQDSKWQLTDTGRQATVLHTGSVFAAAVDAAGNSLNNVLLGATTLEDTVDGAGQTIDNVILTNIKSRTTPQVFASTPRNLTTPSDEGIHIRMTSSSPNTVQIPANASEAFAIGARILVEQYGTGTTSFAITSDTLNSRGGLVSMAGQFGFATLLKTGTTEWALFGDLA